MANPVAAEAVRIDFGPIAVDGDLHVPEHATGLVVFAHGQREQPLQPSEPRGRQRCSNTPAWGRCCSIC
jgi:hypothetical protein